MKIRNPRLIKPSMDRATILSSGDDLSAVSFERNNVHVESINTQSNSDPSCPPHTAAILYPMGSAVFEFEATYRTEKSS